MSQEELLACLFYQKNTVANLKKIADTPTDDVLYGSVYTPNATGKKPVMVWIHGGVWSVGCPEEYNATPIAGTGAEIRKVYHLQYIGTIHTGKKAMGDVVVVCLPYRLGPHGFLFGNWGLHDVILGLEWVRDNISAFGGDKDNVTIFGESAGGWSVDALMASTKAVGLFHKAIAQSGCLLSILTKYSEVSPAIGYLQKKWNLDSEEAVREKATNMSADDLVKLGEEMDKEQVPYKFNLDGDFFTQSPWNGFEAFDNIAP